MSAELCAHVRRHPDGGHDGTHAEDGLLCRGCVRHLEQVIAGLPATAGWLAANTARNNTSGERVTGSADAPIPVNLTVMALLGHAHDCSADGCHTLRCFELDEDDQYSCPGHHDPYGADTTPSIPWTLFSWVRLILEEQPSMCGPRKTTVSALAGWLIARLPWVVRQSWVAEMCAELDRLASAAHGAAPWRIEPLGHRRRPVPCKRCELRAIVSVPGGKYPFECVEKLGGCGRLYTADEYQQWAAMLGAYYRQQAC